MIKVRIQKNLQMRTKDPLSRRSHVSLNYRKFVNTLNLESENGQEVSLSMTLSSSRKTFRSDDLLIIITSLVLCHKSSSAICCFQKMRDSV